MKYTTVDALSRLRPGAEWIVRGDVYSGIEWLDSGQTKPTETEINNKIAELDAAEAMRLLRLERNSRLAETDWMACSDVTMSEDWKTYRQALRDITTHSNWPNLKVPDMDGSGDNDWPTKPS